MCESKGVWIFLTIFTLRLFLFLIVNRLCFIYIYAVPAVPTCTAFPVLSSAAGSVCVCVCVFVFLVNKWIYLIKVLQLRRHSWYGNTWKRSHRTLCPNAHDAFCANTHNSSGLICCSFPSPLLSLSSKPMGLMAQDLSLLPLLVVRL